MWTVSPTKEVNDAEGREHQLDGGQAHKGDRQGPDIGFPWGKPELHPELSIHIQVVDTHRDCKVKPCHRQVQQEQAPRIPGVPQAHVVSARGSSEVTEKGKP